MKASLPMEEKKLGRFKKSWLLTRGAWRALKLDKELLWIPIIGVAISLITLAIGVLGATLNPELFYAYQSSVDGAEGQLTPLGYIALILLGAVLTMISTVTAAAVIHGAIERFNGNNPTVRSSIRAAWRRALPLAGFALFSYTIGAIISFIAERIPFGGRLVEWLGHTAWNLASFFAIPIIVNDNRSVGPIDATKRSFTIMKSVWGESLITGVTIAIISGISAFVIVGLSIASLIAAAYLQAPAYSYAIVGILMIAGIFATTLVFTTLEAFVKAAIYHFATTGESPVVFDSNLLRQAFTQKKARKVFGA